VVWTATVEVCDGIIELGLGVEQLGAVFNSGVPLPETAQVSVTALLKPLVALTDTVDVVDAPAETVTGDTAFSEKSIVGVDTTKVTDVLLLRDPDVPVTATSYVFVDVPDTVLMVKVAVAGPEAGVMDAGLNEQLAPDGNPPLQANCTALPNPFMPVAEIV